MAVKRGKKELWSWGILRGICNNLLNCHMQEQAPKIRMWAVNLIPFIHDINKETCFFR